MANGIQVRNRLAECITRAADETDNAELRRQLRALARTEGLLAGVDEAAVAERARAVCKAYLDRA